MLVTTRLEKGASDRNQRSLCVLDERDLDARIYALWQRSMSPILKLFSERNEDVPDGKKSHRVALDDVRRQPKSTAEFRQLV